MIGVGIAAVAVVVAFFSYVSTVRNNLSQRLLDRYYAILQLAVDKPRFIDPSLTREYEAAFTDKAERQSYEAFASLCWSHARDILDAHFLIVFFRRRFVRQYCNAFEIYRNLHYTWLKRNDTFVPRRRFHRFIARCKWRDYVSPRTADELRWSYTEDTYLNALQSTPDRIGDYIAALTPDVRQRMTVADLGCGHGVLVKRLAEAGFGTVLGVDYSRKMISHARTLLGTQPNVTFKQVNLARLADLDMQLDVAFSINSVLPREPADTPVILRGIATTLKPGGHLVAILPAYDTIKELKDFELPRFVERRRGKGLTGRGILAVIFGRWDRWKAFHVEKRMSGWFGNGPGRSSMVRLAIRKFAAYPVGPHQYADDGANIQRFVRSHDIVKRLHRVGLEVTVGPEKVAYTWEEAVEHGYGNFPVTSYLAADPPAQKIFDWFVIARKPSVAA